MTPIGICTTVVNRPRFLELQARLFRKYLRNAYEFHVVDDSAGGGLARRFEKICRAEGLHYHRKPTRFDGPDASMAAAQAIQWAYDQVLRPAYADRVAMLLDSDMFLVEEFDAAAYIAGHTLAGLLQRRAHVVYLWVGLMIFNMPEMLRHGGDIDFAPGLVDGNPVDTGGQSYHFIHREGVRLRETDPDMRPAYPAHYMGVHLRDPAVTQGYDVELHCGGRFLHFRAGTNWFRDWRSSSDPLKKKTRMVERLLLGRL